MGCPLVKATNEADYLDKLEEYYSNIVYFWKGGITFEWLENQPLKKVLSIVKNQNRLIKEEEKCLSKSR